MTEQERQRRVERAKSFWDGFYRCPTTGRILEGMEGDDKVLCRCKKSNPRVPEERTEETGVHIRRYLRQATAEDFVAQEEMDEQRRRIAQEEKRARG